MGGFSPIHWLVLLVPVAAIAIVLARVSRKGGREVGAPPGSAVGRVPAHETVPTVPSDLETRLWVLLRDGQKIQAIKMVHEEMGLNLQRSKLTVEDVERRLPPVVR